jgi:membrane protease YdiL (CAAX protease family)
MLLLLMIAGAMLGYIIALASIPLVFQIPFSALMGVLNMDSGLEITPAVLKYVQLILATFVFIVPANAYSHLFSDNTFVFFEFKKPSLVFLFFAALLWLFTLPIISFLADINNKIAFPTSFAGLENSFRLAEARAENATRFLLNITSVSGLMVNLLVIAVVAAIAEELIFRGIIQKLLFEQSKNIHLAIWLTALVFSLFHLQFFAIIPRIVLGAALGYTFYWSKSIWVPIFFHFINNASIVLASYLYQQKVITTDPNEITFFPISVLFVAFICSIAIIYFWIKRAK